jgi:hypothetical protein
VKNNKKFDGERESWLHKSEARNPKQIPRLQIPMTETGRIGGFHGCSARLPRRASSASTPGVFGSSLASTLARHGSRAQQPWKPLCFEFWSFVLVSDFMLRISNLVQQHPWVVDQAHVNTSNQSAFSQVANRSPVTSIAIINAINADLWLDCP